MKLYPDFLGNTWKEVSFVWSEKGVLNQPICLRAQR